MIINFDPLRTQPVQVMRWLVEGLYNYLKSIIFPRGVLSFFRVKFLILSLIFVLDDIYHHKTPHFRLEILQAEIGTFVSNT